MAKNPDSHTLARRDPAPYFLAIAALLALASCAGTQSTSSQTSAAQSAPIAASQAAACPTAAKPPLGLLAPPEIANKPGYFELSASVADKSGGAIPGLKEADFVASSSGMRLPIAYFHDACEAPVTLGILVDSSGSMDRKLPTIRSVLADLLAKSDPLDELFLVAFSSRPFLLQRLTTTHAAIADKLPLLHAFGQTDLYDAILASLPMLQHGHYTQKSLLVITDGMDNTSEATLELVTAKARQQSVPIYIIGIGDPAANPSSHGWFSSDLNSLNSQPLNEIANSSGGQAFIVPLEGNQFADAIASIDGQLHRGYTLGVIVPTRGISPVHPIAASSPTPPASESAIRIIVANHPDAVVTTHLIKPPHP